MMLLDKDSDQSKNAVLLLTVGCSVKEERAFVSIKHDVERTSAGGMARAFALRTNKVSQPKLPPPQQDYG